MNLTTTSPAEIDAKLSKLGYDRAVNEMRAEQMAAAATRQAGMYNEATYIARSQEHAAKAAALAEEMAPLEAEFIRRGGWTRAFLVSNTGGHVHKNMHCGTCFPTTQYAWMTEFSGMDEAEIVDAAGERACTVCYPTAPAAVLSQPTRMFTPDEKERQAAKAEREAKAAAARSATVVTTGGVVYKTERAASNAAASAIKDIAWYDWNESGEGIHPSNVKWVTTAKEALEAIEAKTGEPQEERKEKMIATAAAAVVKAAKDWNKSPQSDSPMYNGKVEVPAKADVIAGIKRFL